MHDDTSGERIFTTHPKEAAHKAQREKHISFTDFNQPQGVQMNQNNRRFKKIVMIPLENLSFLMLCINKQ